MSKQFVIAVSVCIALGSFNETRIGSISNLPSVIDSSQVGAVSFGHLKNNPVILYRGTDRYIQVKGKIFHLNTRKRIEEEEFLEMLLDIELNGSEEIAFTTDSEAIIVDIKNGRIYTEELSPSEYEVEMFNDIGEVA